MISKNNFIFILIVLIVDYITCSPILPIFPSSLQSYTQKNGMSWMSNAGPSSGVSGGQVEGIKSTN